MQKLAEAVVYAATYIDCRDGNRDDVNRADVKALESLASILQQAEEKELNALAEAAERALAAELARPLPQERFVTNYRQFMEYMMGDPWRGNRKHD